MSNSDFHDVGFFVEEGLRAVTVSLRSNGKQLEVSVGLKEAEELLVGFAECISIAKKQKADPIRGY